MASETRVWHSVAVVGNGQGVHVRALRGIGVGPRGPGAAPAGVRGEAPSKKAES